jgi:membrane protein
MTEEQTHKQIENEISHKSLAEKIKQGWDMFCNWVWEPIRPGGFPGSGLLRNVLRIIFIVIRESQDDRITLRASALTFTVVLSLVPMLALGTAVLKGLGAGDQMRQAAYSFIQQFEAESAETTAMPETSELSPAGEGVEQPQSTPADKQAPTGAIEYPKGLTSHLQRAVDQIFDYVERTNFATLGTLGIIGMVLAALGVLGSIEQSMNSIWQTTTGRALGRKLIDYMALMILLPVSINLALATAATLQSPALHSQIQEILPLFWFEKFFLKGLPIAVLVVTFLLLYRFLPNTRVGFIPALAGGLFGGLTWYWVQIMYVKLQIGVSKYNAIYGSFATLPLFFLWIYIAWVVFLLGAEVAFAFQTWRQYQWKSVLITPSARLAMAFDIMEVALADYNARKITDRKSLAHILNQTEKTMAVILTDLVNGGLLRRVEGKLEGYVPAAPVKELKPSEIMDIILGKDLPDVKGCDLVRQALQAARSTLDRYTITCQEVTLDSDQKTKDFHSGTS